MIWLRIYQPLCLAQLARIAIKNNVVYVFGVYECSFQYLVDTLCADKERAEKELLSEYLPEQLSEEEIKTLVDEAVAELKPEGMKDMGRVIGAVKAKAGNSADGSLIAKLVKDSLQ